MAKKQLHFSVQTEDSKSKKVKNFSNNFYLTGVRMLNVTEQDPKHGFIQGVRVLGVDKYSAAWIAGLRPGDIIVSVKPPTY